MLPFQKKCQRQYLKSLLIYYRGVKFSIKISSKGILALGIGGRKKK
jgi:hypothetical protein